MTLQNGYVIQDLDDGTRHLVIICEGSVNVVNLPEDYANYPSGEYDTSMKPIEPEPAPPAPTETRDRSTVVLTTEQIGRTQHLTAEGYLLCMDVRIARVGDMLYLPGEVPEISPASGQPFTVVTRDAQELFSEETIASFLGKSVTNEHPDEMLDTTNHKRHSCGHAVDVRRGEGLDEGFLLADLLITDAQAIKDAQGKKKEVSCGYHAEYQEIRPGYGRQYTIRGNHIALVMRGRGGPSCAIQDSEKDVSMPAEKTKPRPWRDRLRAAFQTKDEAAFEAELEASKQDPDAPPSKEVVDEDEDVDPVEAMEKRLDAIEARIQALEDGEKGEAKTPTTDEKADDEDEKKSDEKDDEKSDEKKDDDEDEDEKSDKKGETKDSAALSAEHLQTVAYAEILAPGLKLPTFDASTQATKTSDALTSLRRRALAAALANPERSKLIAPMVGTRTKDVATLSSADVSTLFVASAEVVKMANRQDKKPGETPTLDARHPSGGHTPASYQKLIESKRKETAEGSARPAQPRRTN